MKDAKKEIVKQYIENILNTGNSEDVSTFVSPQYTEVVNNRKYHLGIKGIQKKIAGMREIYPDLKLSIDSQFTEGDWVITNYIIYGTQLGSWMGIKPTGRSIEIRGVNIDKIVDNKILEHGSSTDLLDPLIEVHQQTQHALHWIKDNLHRRLNDQNGEIMYEQAAA